MIQVIVLIVCGISSLIHDQEGIIVISTACLSLVDCPRDRIDHALDHSGAIASSEALLFSAEPNQYCRQQAGGREAVNGTDGDLEEFRNISPGQQLRVGISAVGGVVRH